MIGTNSCKAELKGRRDEGTKRKKNKKGAGSLRIRDLGYALCIDLVDWLAGHYDRERRFDFIFGGLQSRTGKAAIEPFLDEAIAFLVVHAVPN